MKINIFFLVVVFLGCREQEGVLDLSIFNEEKEKVLRKADEYSVLEPITVTASICERSTGGIHDFYSEGDYWWSDPENPNGSYIRKDGMTNPENFTDHRKAMIRFSQIAGALASRYMVTDDKTYAEKLVPHLKAWFLDANTLMNPNLLYGQAIIGRVTGRGIGIIDTIHLMEVAKAIKAIQNSRAFSAEELKGIKKWFADYLGWLTTYDYGKAERDNSNNHSVCWALQVAVFSELTGNESQLEYVRAFYKNTLLPNQMAKDGSFSLELKRTKPYGYSLFTLDAMTALCQVLSSREDNLFRYTTEDGKNISKGIDFLYPYTRDKNNWPFKRDVMYWEEWPVLHPYLWFGGLKLDELKYIELWNTLDADFDTPEVIRNMPIKYSMLWVRR